MLFFWQLNDIFEKLIPNQRFPFDWKNPIGYLVAVSFQYLTIRNLYMFAANLISLGIGLHLFTLSVTSDIKIQLNSISQIAKPKRNRKQIIKYLLDFVRNNSFEKQLSERKTGSYFIL